MARDELAALDAAATNGPWTGYSEPDVGLPWSLFEGVPGQTGFAPLEPLTGGDVNLIAYLRNHVPDILALIDENARLREAVKRNSCGCSGRCSAMEWLPADNSLCSHAFARAALSPNPDQQES